MRERVLGLKHQHTVATRNFLAYWTRKADADSGSDVRWLPLVLPCPARRNMPLTCAC